MKSKLLYLATFFARSNKHLFTIFYGIRKTDILSYCFVINENNYSQM